MHFGVLGPVEVWRDGHLVAPPGRKPRVLLAVLLCRAGQLVSADALVEALWRESPPRSAIDNLRGYVYQLRRVLGDDSRVVRRQGGYVLVVRDGELDAWLFEELAGRGRDLLAAGRPDDARQVLTEAPGLWRGPAFADLADAPIVTAEAVRLRERHLSVLEARADADLATGRHAVAELSVLTAEHPLRERFRAQLMLALYRSGRQAESLQVYRPGAGDRRSVWSGRNLGQPRLHHNGLGQPQQATRCYEHAIELYREIGDRYNEGDSLASLGDAQRAAGDLDSARAAWQQALIILDQLRHADAGRVRARLAELNGLAGRSGDDRLASGPAPAARRR